jgi:hypothetical protein
MQCQHVLLLDALHRHKPHAGTRDRLADRGIIAIVLVALAIRLHKLRAHHLHLVTELGKSPPPVMCTAASFNADQTRLQLCNRLHQL